MGAGTPATLGEAMALVYEKNDSPFLKTLFPPSEMEGDWVFGRTLGAVRLCCAMLSPLYSIWQHTKTLG